MSSRLETPPDATTGRGGAVHDLAQQVEVRALQRAVLGDVGDDVAAAARLLEAVEHLPQVAALLGPAARRERRAAHVEADRDRLAVLARSRDAAHSGFSSAAVPRLMRLAPVVERGSRDSSSRMPPESSMLTPRDLADRPSSGSRALLPRPNAASRSTRWIHSAPWSAQSIGRVDGIAVVRLGARLTLRQADGLAAGDVDGRKQHQARGSC